MQGGFIMSEKGFGLIFITVGVVSFIICGILSVGTMSLGDYIWLLPIGIGLIFFVAFGSIGMYIYKKGKKKDEAIKYIIENGKRYTGKIVDYTDGQGIYVNGIPPLDLLVEILYNGEKCLFQVPTNKYNTSEFPIDSTINIAILNQRAVLIPDYNMKNSENDIFDGTGSMIRKIKDD